MPRRRARLSFQSELPIQVSAVESPSLEAFEWPDWMDPVARERMAFIAHGYALGRQLERNRTPRPEVRRTMEGLAASARALQMSAHLAPLPLRVAIYRTLKDSEASLLKNVFSTQVGYIMEELAERPWKEFVEMPAPPKKLSVCLERLAENLIHLPMDCTGAFDELQQYALLFETEWPAPVAIEKFAERIAIFASLAAKLMKGDRGPRSSHIQMRTVEALMLEFKNGGRTATHCVTADGEYSATPLSEFGEFVHAFFNAIEPDQCLRQGINEALEYACWPVRHVRKERQVDEAGRKRQRLIEAELAGAGVTIFPFSD